MLSRKENEKRIRRARDVIGAVIEGGGRSHTVRRARGEIVLACGVEGREATVFDTCLVNCPSCAIRVIGFDPGRCPTAAWDGIAHRATSIVLVRKGRSLHYAEVLLQSETACDLVKRADTREMTLGQEPADCLACLGAS